MLCADPVSKEIRRFFVGPKECEVTGITFTPDSKTLFINIQHPGEAGDSHWPDAGNSIPRSSTVIIPKDDGGVIGSYRNCHGLPTYRGKVVLTSSTTRKPLTRPPHGHQTTENR